MSAKDKTCYYCKHWSVTSRCSFWDKSKSMFYSCGSFTKASHRQMSTRKDLGNANKAGTAKRSGRERKATDK